MKPRGPLMIEHRLIEKMIAVVEDGIGRMEETREADPVFIDTVVDFIRTYADRTHHGKEEEILFAELAKKDLPEKHARIMDELVEEHKLGRKITGELVAAKESYQAGNGEALAVILEKLKTLVDFYPRHIEKEDKVFFPETEGAFSQEELDAMLASFWEFDRTMIHEKYENVVATLTKK